MRKHAQEPSGLVANAFADARFALAPCVLKKGMPNLGPRKTTGCLFLGSSKFWFSFFPVKLQNWGTNSLKETCMTIGVERLKCVYFMEVLTSTIWGHLTVGIKPARE